MKQEQRSSIEPEIESATNNEQRTTKDEQRKTKHEHFSLLTISYSLSIHDAIYF